MIAKIAFLFLTIANIYHEQTWINFFRGHQDKYSLYVHSKKPLSQESFFKPYELRSKVETSWTNTMLAQQALLKEALTDPAHEKFIFVSESTIPLQTFDEIYEKLMSTHESFLIIRATHTLRAPLAILGVKRFIKIANGSSFPERMQN